MLWVVSLCSVVLSISWEWSTVLSWIPPKVTMLHGSQWRKFFRQNLLRRASIKKSLDQISVSDAPKLSSLMLSLMLENGWHASLPLKVFRTESWGEIPVRGEGCNTSVVSHELSNGFELKHDMISVDEGVKIKSTKSELQLKLGQHTLTYMWTLVKIMQE